MSVVGALRDADLDALAALLVPDDRPAEDVKRVCADPNANADGNASLAALLDVCEEHGFDCKLAAWSVEKIEVRADEARRAEALVALKHDGQALSLLLETVQTERGWHLVFANGSWEPTRLAYRMLNPATDPDPLPDVEDPAPAPRLDEHADPFLKSAAVAMPLGYYEASEKADDVAKGLLSFVSAGEVDRAIELSWALAGLMSGERIRVAFVFLALPVRFGRPEEAARAIRAIGSLACRYRLEDMARGYGTAARYFDDWVPPQRLGVRGMAFGVMRAIELASDARHLMPELVERLKVPDAWFESHFHPESARLLAYAYRELWAANLERVVREIAIDLEERGGLPEVQAEWASARTDSASGAQLTLLRVMSTPARLATLRIGPSTYHSFADVDGSLRWLGKLWLGQDTKQLVELAEAGHASGFEPSAGAGDAGVTGWLNHIVASAAKAGKI